MHPKYWHRKANNHVLREEAGEGSAGGAAMDVYSAGQSFPGLADAVAEEVKPEEAEAKPVAEASAEDAATRLAEEEAKAAEPKPESEAEQAETYTIKVDGKDVTVTAAEMAEHYKNGLRQADYTKKTMEAADARKSAEAEADKARAERDQYATKLQHFAIQANGELESLAKTLTEELLTSDPVEYLRQERIFKERQAQLSSAQQELQQIGLQQQQEREQAHQSYQAEQLEKLHAKLPEWKDPAKAKVEAAQIKEYLGAQEFGAEDIAQLSDHRLILLARKAMQYDSLMAKAKDAVKKVSAAPAKVEKPGNGVSPTDGRTRAMKQLAESGGSLRAAANVFSQFL